MKMYLYDFGREAAKAGHLIPCPSPVRHYGYGIKNTYTGKTAFWYKYKRDAQARINALRD